MSKDANKNNLDVLALMQVHGESSGGQPEEFRFWTNDFDGVRYAYDHLNAEGDVKKAKSYRPQ